MVTIDALGKKVQCESKDSDSLKYFKRHGFDNWKALNYMSIYRVGAIDRVNIKTEVKTFQQINLTGVV